MPDLSSRKLLILLSMLSALVLTITLMRDASGTDREPADSEKPSLFERLFGDKEDDHPKISLSEAKQRIARAEQLESIPKSVWKQLLSKEQYDILWEADTERPFTGKWLKENREGVFVTAGCRLPVFSSDHKFKSGTGWPSFWDVVNEGNVVLKTDYSWGMKRTEVLSKCGEHLGHVFDDGPKPTGLRYCINSLALDFIPTPVPDKS